MADGTDAAERGIALLDLGRPAEAERHFRQALASGPTDPDLQVYLARSLHQQERFAEARDAAMQAVATAPENLGAIMVLSAALAGVKDFDRALDVVRRALQIAPNWAPVHRQEGALLIAQDKSAEAFGPLERARALDPEDPATIAMIGSALYNVRRFAEAEEAAADALRLDPNHADAHQLRGMLALRRGGGRSAVDAHRTALREDPTDPGYREGLALAMKSRNPLYGQLLRFSDWLEGLPGGTRWLVILAPYLLSRALSPFRDQLWSQVLLVVVSALVLLSWALEPVMNTVLVCSTYARNLLPRVTKLATYAFLVYVAAALASVVAGLATDTERALVLAMFLGLWAITAGQVHLVGLSRRKLAIGLQGAGAALALVTAAAVALSSPAAVPLLGALFLFGIAMLWFTVLA